MSEVAPPELLGFNNWVFQAGRGYLVDFEAAKERIEQLTVERDEALNCIRGGTYIQKEWIPNIFERMEKEIERLTAILKYARDPGKSVAPYIAEIERLTQRLATMRGGDIVDRLEREIANNERLRAALERIVADEKKEHPAWVSHAEETAREALRPAKD